MKIRTEKLRAGIVLISLSLVLAGCGGLVRGQPPLVGVSSLEVGGQAIRTRIDVHNPNGVDMHVDVIEMSMTLGDSDLGRHSARPGVSIHPNGTEDIDFDFPASEGARRQLAELESGRINSIAYSVTGQVRDSGGASEKFSQQGYLYPVPGRPGHFRGAGPKREQSREW